MGAVRANGRGWAGLGGLGLIDENAERGTVRLAERGGVGWGESCKMEEASFRVLGF